MFRAIRMGILRVLDVEWFEVLGFMIMGLALGGWLFMLPFIAIAVEEPFRWYKVLPLGVLLAFPAFVIFMIVLQFVVGLVGTAIDRIVNGPAPQSKASSASRPQFSASSGGASGFSNWADGSSYGYGANMDGPYGRFGGGAGVDYPSSWHGPNEPGGSLDI